ncbi:hypothetical protein [Streptomyces sp. KLOTTS4A1]|uniref:hypothetical protein n=1 Tax=Streptomyces sp. KLOTTS4A1 TaxID=3390996 RepID=UPI0039F5952B
MSARTHAAPVFGNPSHWAAGPLEKGRTARHSLERITAATKDAFHLRFLAQSLAAADALAAIADVPAVDAGAARSAHIPQRSNSFWQKLVPSPDGQSSWQAVADSRENSAQLRHVPTGCHWPQLSLLKE